MILKVIEFLKGRNWVYTIGKKPDSIFFSLHAQNGIYHCFGEDRSEIKTFLFLSFLGTSCPLVKRDDMCRMLTMINSNLLYGNFEMELDSGDIKFRTGIIYDHIEITNEAIGNIISKNIDIIDLSHPYLQKFIYGEATMLEVYDSLYP